MVLYDVHTVTEPVRHFQRYEDPALAHRAAARHARVVHESLVVEPVEDTAVPVPSGRAEATT